MTIQSLQKIISLENELHAAELSEKEKASAWLKEQREEILRQHEREWVALDEKIAEVKAHSAAEAKKKAAARVKDARDRADFLARLEVAILRRHLEKALQFIIGHGP